MKQRVRIVRDFPALKLVGRQLGPFAAGQETDLEIFEAAVLERNGFAESLQKITPTELRKLMLEEERISEPAALQQGFYASLAQCVSDSRKAGQQEEVEELHAALAALIETRVQKLVRLATSPPVPENLLPEEKFLVNRLTMVLEDWNRWLENSFRKEEEVGEIGKFGGTIRHVVGGAPDIQKSGVSASNVHTGGTTAP